MNPEVVTLLVNIAVSTLVGAGAALFVIGQYKAKVDRVIEDQKECDKKRTEMKTELDKLLEFKVSTQKFIDSKLYTAQSPLGLSDFGKKLTDESGLTDIFKDVRDDLVVKLNALGPTTQYDVQEKARALLDDLTDYAPFKPVAKYAFDHGIDLSQILRAGAILLRDYYFEKHPEVIDPKEQW